MKGITLTILLIKYSCCLVAQKTPDESTLLLNKNITECLILGLDYLDTTQRKETVLGDYYSGEWQNYMCLQNWFLLLGSKKRVEDSNCFSVASIHNSLAKIYLKYPEYSNIPNMLDLSFERIMAYKSGDEFNFWNLLPPMRKLKKNDIVGKQPLVRRPTHYKLKTKYINNAANIANDNDDTALGYIAIALRNRIKEKDYIIDSSSAKVKAIAPIFNRYRDVNRKNRHWYNYLHGNDNKTGAYLTWLADEYQFKKWNILKVVGHNATFFLPFSECYPHAYKPYLPYGSNDIDGVVNSNILSALALNNELDSASTTAAISYIEKKCKSKKFDHVGIYYPNRYQFPYAVSEAYASGVKQLQKSTQYLVEFLLETQNADGSWSSKRIVNKNDRLQSTAYALNSLINIGDFGKNKTISSINNAIDFILQHAIRDSLGVHWEGGVFFSGGTVVRHFLFWKSDAYTTVIILNAFANLKKYIEQNYNIVNYGKNF